MHGPWALFSLPCALVSPGVPSRALSNHAWKVQKWKEKNWSESKLLDPVHVVTMGPERYSQVPASARRCRAHGQGREVLLGCVWGILWPAAMDSHAATGGVKGRVCRTPRDPCPGLRAVTVISHVVQETEWLSGRASPSGRVFARLCGQVWRSRRTRAAAPIPAFRSGRSPENFSRQFWVTEGSRQ